MNDKDAKKLKVGQRVMWKENPLDLGTVEEVNSYSVKISWDQGLCGLHEMDEMELISVYKAKK
jgi:hypothetical protein